MISQVVYSLFLTITQLINAFFKLQLPYVGLDLSNTILLGHSYISAPQSHTHTFLQLALYTV